MKTSQTGENVKQISTVSELLELATVSYEKVSVEILTEREQFQKKLFTDAVKDVGFFYDQFRRYVNRGTQIQACEYLSEKLDKLLNFMEEDLDRTKEPLLEYLGTDDKDSLTAVVYILSSLEKDLESSSCLNEILAAFNDCKPEQIPCYINGLTHGKHPKLDNSLKLIHAIAPEKIKKACKTILQNRKQNHKSDNR